MHFLNRRELLGASLGAAFTRTLHAIPLSEIKLGITTDEIDEDVATAAKFLQEYGLKWAEVRNIWGKYNTAQPLEEVRRANSILADHGVKVSIEGTGFFKVPLPPDTPEGQKALDKQWTLLDDSCERAKIFGTDKIRTFAFTLRKGEAADPKTMSRIYALVSESARRAKAKGMRLAIENVGDSYVWTGGQAGELLKHVKEDNLGLTWDPNNAGAAGEKSFPDGYRHLDPARIFHVHLRDYKKNAEGKVEWAAVGTGEFDNAAQIRALRKEGFKGTFTLETHWRHPQGKMYATRTSLQALLQVIAKV